ncbi:hypothetical protein TWF730_003947 [Orbilia blumenaviensis]|uniref:Uncharacterized protein n=1 Tax=Orbilia blumenaviensis TaxID=1796055 RepID=A0AAV9U3T8_9PEZI
MSRPFSFPRWDNGPNSNGLLANLCRNVVNDFDRYYQEFRRRLGVDEIGPMEHIGLNSNRIAPAIIAPAIITPSNPEPQWEEEDVFRTEFLDNLKARYAASQQGIHDSWDPSLGVIGSGDGPWDVPGRNLHNQPRTYTGRCKYYTGNGARCLENVKSKYSRYCVFHHVVTPGGRIFNSTGEPPAQMRPRPFGGDPGLTTSPFDSYSRFDRSQPWRMGTDPRSAAYRAATDDLQLQSINRLQQRWNEVNGGYRSPINGNNTLSLSPQDLVLVGPNGPELTTSQAAEIFIRELDTDYRPFYLKCSVCHQIYNDPVYFWHPQTNQLCISCRGCVGSLCDNPPTYTGSDNYSAIVVRETLSRDDFN